MKLSEILSDRAIGGLLEEVQKVAEGLRPNAVQAIIDDETKIFNEAASITVHNKIPDTTKIPIEKPTHWLKINDVVACFVDMEGSTKLSANQHDNSTAKAYRYFTNTAIRIFHQFESPYIDVKGDGSTLR